MYTSGTAVVTRMQQLWPAYVRSHGAERVFALWRDTCERAQRPTASAGDEAMAATAVVEEVGPTLEGKQMTTCLQTDGADACARLLESVPHR
jgi:hypothetical protein